MKVLKPARKQTRNIFPYAKAIEDAIGARISLSDICDALAANGVPDVTVRALRYYRTKYFCDRELMAMYEQLSLPSLFEAPQLQPPAFTIDTTERGTQDTHNAQPLQIPTPRQKAPAETTPTPPPTSVPATTSEELPPKRPRVQPIDHLPPRRQDIEICTGDPIVISEGVIAQWGRWKKGIMPGPKFICQIVGPELKVRFGTRVEQGTWAWAYEFCDVPYTVELIMQEAAVCEMQNKPPDTPIDEKFLMPYGKAPILKEYAEWYEAHEEERSRDAR